MQRAEILGVARDLVVAGPHAVFGLTARIVTDPVSDTPMIVPLGRHPMALAAE